MAPSFIVSGVTASVIHISDSKALKCAFREHVSEVEFEQTVLEHLGLHRGIVRHFSNLHEGQITLEYYPYDVRRYVATSKPIPLELWALQLVETIIFIHAKGVIHRDLSPRNMLTSGGNGGIVLCDFAASSVNGKRQADIKPECRFYHWHTDRTEIQDDLFAMGSVLFELSTRQPPYAELQLEEIRRLYRAGIFPLVDSLFMGKVITKCWMGNYESAEQFRSDLMEILKRRSMRGSHNALLFVAIGFMIAGSLYLCRKGLLSQLQPILELACS